MAMQIFGLDRYEFDSDWSVFLLVANNNHTIALLHEGADYLSADSQKIIFSDSTVEAFWLDEGSL